jgi:tetratricopeptide (TPR) repeat protein
MSWESIGSQLTEADEAALGGHNNSAIDIYHSLLVAERKKGREIQHYLFRRLALGYTAIGADKEARSSFNAAFDLSRTDTDYAEVFYDRGISLMNRGLFIEAIEDFRAALLAYGSAIHNEGPAAVLRLIEDRIQECKAGIILAQDKPGTDNKLLGEDTSEWSMSVADRPGESTSEILVSWDERSTAPAPEHDA